MTLPNGSFHSNVLARSAQYCSGSAIDSSHLPARSQSVGGAGGRRWRRWRLWGRRIPRSALVAPGQALAAPGQGGSPDQAAAGAAADEHAGLPGAPGAAEDLCSEDRPSPTVAGMGWERVCGAYSLT